MPSTTTINDSALQAKIHYPTQSYSIVLNKMVKYYEAYLRVFAIVLIGSLARGKAAPGSCIDLTIFLHDEEFEKLAYRLNDRAKAYSRLGGEICFYSGDVEGGVQFDDIRVDLVFTDGRFRKGCNPFDMVNDEFETTIGNLFVYGAPLFTKGNKYGYLRSKYLPFYNEDLRQKRLDGTKSEFNYKVWKTRWLASRGEHIAAFDTLLETTRIFLQHLFIKQRKYPIDYCKWLKEQCQSILAMPELYRKLVAIIGDTKLSKKGIEKKAVMLERLMQQYGAY